MIEKLKAQCKEMTETSDFNIKQELKIFLDHLENCQNLEFDQQQIEVDDQAILNVMEESGWDDDIDLEFEQEVQIVEY